MKQQKNAHQENQLEKYLEGLRKRQRTIIIAERQSKEEIIKMLVKKHGINSGTIGSYHVGCRKEKVYIGQQPTVKFKETELYGVEIAKALILYNLEISGRKLGYRKTTAIILENTPHPLFAKPGYYENYTYVDLKAHYFNMIKKLWGIKYARGYWLGYENMMPFTIPEEFKVIEKLKVFRNALYGLIRSRGIIRWEMKEQTVRYKLQSYPNPIFYPDLCLIILDVSQALATLAVTHFDCVYVAIDGFIMPNKQAEKFKAYLKELGLECSTKGAGNCTVKNLYTYSFELIRTKQFEKAQMANETRSNLIFTPTESEDILKRIAPRLTKQ
jgi:hypothetical protein